MMSRSTSLLASGVLWLLACGGEAPRDGEPDAAAAQSSTPTSAMGPQVDTLLGGVIRVTNRSPVDSGKWSLVLDRTIQPPDDDPGELRTPTGMVLLDDGSLIVADQNPAQIRRYDSQGRFAGAIGRDGEGPGEYRSPMLGMRGDTLVVHDPSLSRTNLFSLSTGKLLAIYRGTPRSSSPIGIDGSGRIVMPIPLSWPTAPGATMQNGFVRLTLDGRRTDTLKLPAYLARNRMWHVDVGGRTRVGLHVPLQPDQLDIADLAGGFLIGSTASATVVASQNGRDTTMLFSRPQDARPVTRAEKERILDRIVEQFARHAERNPGSPLDVPESALRSAFRLSDMPDARPVYDELSVDGRGRRWLRRDEMDPTTIRFDLFDRDGRWLDIVSIPAERWIPRERAMNDPYVRLPAWASDHVAIPVEDADGAMAIQIYRIVRGGG